MTEISEQTCKKQRKKPRKKEMKKQRKKGLSKYRKEMIINLIIKKNVPKIRL